MAEEPQTDRSHPHPTPPTPNSAVTPQVPGISGFQVSPLILPGMLPMQNPDYNEHGSGIYAIPHLPYTRPMAGFSPNTLIPLKYNIPTRPSSGGASDEHGQEARQQHGPQRQVAVRRFHLAFQLDLGLIIKLAAMVFLLSQDGSPQKLVLLIFFASLVYLYQTGALAPFIHWLQQAGAPPRLQAPIRLQNGPPVGRDGQNDPQPVENHGVDDQNRNQPAENQEQPDTNDNHPEPEGHGNNFWGVVKEIQLFVVGFLTSLLPGFHNNN
ncbi:hypothetical protein MUK42_26669 [Musa troglodytarum]|uniref:Uncharacterized protein n=1 Tax=Musa troglodytarum TaxID=320322 RepID=A0A9E7EYH3_9LILI|nr:hypothetical protein MUK42_26669 [Musa troglodytarum]